MKTYKIFLLLIAISTVTSATVIDGNNYCIGPYALCSAAQCKPIPGDTKHVRCACEGPNNGLNVGPTSSSCKSRTQALTSTFSLENQFSTAGEPGVRYVICKGNNVRTWASCFGAPCTTEMGSVVCKCPLEPASASIYYTETCPTNEKELAAICSQLSSAAATDASAESTIAAFYGNPPAHPACPAINST